MSQTLVIAQLILMLLPKIKTGTDILISWINSVKQAAQQSGEWTPEFDAAYRAALIASGNDPSNQPDPSQ